MPQENHERRCPHTIDELFRIAEEQGLHIERGNLGKLLYIKMNGGCITEVGYEKLYLYVWWPSSGKVRVEVDYPYMCQCNCG